MNDGTNFKNLRNLRITGVTSTPVNVPMSGSYSFSVGKVAGTTKIIVEVETNEGITGVGETYPVWTMDIIKRIIAPRILGENPFDLERLTSKCLPTNANQSLPYVDVFNLLAFGGVEMALWDIMGKICDVPSAMLMGGIYRKDIPFSDYVFESSTAVDDSKAFIERVVKNCEELVRQHISPVLEFKVGVLDPSMDIKMVEQVRQAIGNDILLRIDANCAWTESTALRTIGAMEKSKIANVEEPCGALSSDSRIRSAVSVPLSVHCTRVRDVAGYALDAVVMNPLQVGGFRRLKYQDAIAEDRGLDIWLHSRAELGFATAAYLHFVASTRHIVHPSQTLMRPTEDFLTREGKPRFEKGMIALTDGPGLGVTLDRGKLDRYHSLFEQQGEFEWLNGMGTSPPFY